MSHQGHIVYMPFGPTYIITTSGVPHTVAKLANVYIVRVYYLFEFGEPLTAHANWPPSV